MKVYAKLLALVVVAVFFFANSQVQAVTITFDSQVPSDNSGLTSKKVASNNLNGIPIGSFNVSTFDSATNTFYVVETFDKKGSSSSTVQVPKDGSGNYNVAVPAGAGFNTLDPSTEMLVYTGGFGIGGPENTDIGGTTIAANPANDHTYYAYAPGADNLNNGAARIRVDYANFLATQLPGYRISYLGLYYGSIDTYNNLAFFSGDTPITGTPLLNETTDPNNGAGVLTGGEILASQPIVAGSGDRFALGSNVYVNLFFDPTESFNAFEFRTNGIAFEADNLVAGFTRVPEPASLLLLGLGLLGLAGVRRRLRK